MAPLFDIASTTSYKFHMVVLRLYSLFCHNTKSETSVLWSSTQIGTILWP